MYTRICISRLFAKELGDLYKQTRANVRFWSSHIWAFWKLKSLLLSKPIATLWLTQPSQCPQNLGIKLKIAFIHNCETNKVQPGTENAMIAAKLIYSSYESDE
jgi:hypothetical protein